MNGIADPTWDPSPPQSQTCKFRVAICTPERWKVESIAQFKQLQANKVVKPLAKKGKSGNGKEVATKSHIPVEHIKKELEILHNNSIVFRKKMMALSSVRTSLLWLLKKSSMVERELVG
jgi:hypothetical protein|mmetsp:Transcript_18925/g.42317  ORF Transcript_18925/g.42317 Transcript_18925/m.42317 type:complete len:119 (+) Transcript_18925:107-463(+)